MPKDNDDFQGLQEDKVDAAPYLDISAELPGVERTKKNESFRRFWTNQSLIFEIWPQPHCTTYGLMVTKQYEQDKPVHSRLHMRCNEVQQ